jgi:glycosyltransferase involved in cell wall biosynthesis
VRRSQYPRRRPRERSEIASDLRRIRITGIGTRPAMVRRRYYGEPRMVASDLSLRVLGVSVADVSDWPETLPAGKWSQFFHALSQRVSLVGVSRPNLPRTDRYLNLARSFSPNKATWLARAGFNLAYVSKLDANLQSELLRRRGSYDLVVQLQTLCSPGPIGVPYVIYTDNTMALTQRVHPQLAPLPLEAINRWQAFESGVCNAAQSVFTFSEFARRSVIDDYGCSPERVVAIGAGANQLVSSLDGKDYTQPRALFVGSPFEPKGGKSLLSAWRMVHERVPDAELVIVGPRSNPAPGFGAGVSWRGRIDRYELAQLYRSATVFVLPSMFDAWGHVFVEAMGHGLPCIGSDCCAMPELIEEGVSGLLVPRDAPAPLADALTEILTDPDKAARMGQAGHERVLRQWTWGHVVDRLMRQVNGDDP